MLEMRKRGFRNKSIAQGHPAGSWAGAHPLLHPMVCMDQWCVDIHWLLQVAGLSEQHCVSSCNCQCAAQGLPTLGSQTVETGWPVLQARTRTCVFPVRTLPQCSPSLPAPREAWLLLPGADVSLPWADADHGCIHPEKHGGLLKEWHRSCLVPTTKQWAGPHWFVPSFLSWRNFPCICLAWGWHGLEKAC